MTASPTPTRIMYTDRYLPLIIGLASLACGSSASTTEQRAETREGVEGDVIAGSQAEDSGASHAAERDTLTERDDGDQDIAAVTDMDDPEDSSEVDETVEVVEPVKVVDAPDLYHQVYLDAVALDEEGESEDLFVDLPPDTSSVFVMVRGDINAFYTLQKVITPAPLSESVVKGPGAHVCVPCKNRVVSAQVIGSFLIPNDPTITVKGGTWVLRVRGTRRVEDVVNGLTFVPHVGTCEVIVLARQEPPTPTGVLPIALHFTGSHGLTAESAPQDERLQMALDTLTMIFAQTGLGIELRGYHDVPGVEEDSSLTEVSSTAGYPNDLSKLFLTGQPEQSDALNIFFVSSIYKDLDYEEVGGVVLGIAGGVPGPAFLGPTERSGVAIGTLDISEDDHLGNVMAHEIGHYLGLFHATERDSIFHDTLMDTEEDDPANLMFWGWSPQQITLSEHQSEVMRSHPFVIPDVAADTEP